jgi:phage terminase large subunit GpA-like protein
MAVDDAGRQARRTLRPPPRLDLAQWIEGNITLPSDVSASPGRMRLWPYQRGICDAIGDPAIERVTMCKGARLGFTVLLTSTIAAYSANEPTSVILLLPTESDCRDFVVHDLEPVFSSSPALAGVLSDDDSGEPRNTILSRRFNGGSLKIVAARAPRNLRRHTCRILLCDEIDGMEPTVEGSPLALAEKRTLSFNNRKIIAGSTPTIEGASAVTAAYAESDRRIYQCPCPECGGLTEIKWEHIEWEPGRPETAAFRCPHCRALIDEHHKADMVATGGWLVTRPAVRGHAGFQLNSLVSLLPNASWARLAEEFVAAKDTPELLQPFVNTVLAEPWRGAGDAIDESTLARRVEPIGLDRIPREVLLLSMGVDVQDDRLEPSVLGWSKTNEIYVLSHDVIWGNFQDPATWRALDDLLQTSWRHPFGGRIGIGCAIVDSGDGDHYDHVLKFCVPRMRNHVFAGKGVFGNRPAFQMAKGKTIASRFAIVGVDVIKTVLFDRLARGQGIHFSDSLEPRYFEEIASQRRVIKFHRGMPQRRFEMVSGRARKECLDALVYGFSARQSRQINFEVRERDLHMVVKPHGGKAQLGGGGISSKLAGHDDAP